MEFKGRNQPFNWEALNNQVAKWNPLIGLGLGLAGLLAQNAWQAYQQHQMNKAARDAKKSYSGRYY